MQLKEIRETLTELRKLWKQHSLSEDYLKELGHTTRQTVGLGGDYLYGIWLVPEELVLDIGESLLAIIDQREEEKDGR